MGLLRQRSNPQHDLLPALMVADMPRTPFCVR